MAWLWKDHTSHAEAEEITAAAAASTAGVSGEMRRTLFVGMVLGEDFAVRAVAPRVFEAAESWVEIADWIPAVLSGTTALGQLHRGACAAGHKCMYNTRWGGFPDETFLSSFHPWTGEGSAFSSGEVRDSRGCGGGAERRVGRQIGFARGHSRRHRGVRRASGAIGAGIREGTLVKIMGTSTCDIMVVPATRPVAGHSRTLRHRR